MCLPRSLGPSTSNVNTQRKDTVHVDNPQNLAKQSGGGCC
jgi:hypothetical protein